MARRLPYTSDGFTTGKDKTMGILNNAKTTLSTDRLARLIADKLTPFQIRKNAISLLREIAGKPLAASLIMRHVSI